LKVLFGGTDKWVFQRLGDWWFLGEVSGSGRTRNVGVRRSCSGVGVGLEESWDRAVCTFGQISELLRRSRLWIGRTWQGGGNFRWLECQFLEYFLIIT
jgi:hypothetical protein